MEILKWEQHQMSKNIINNNEFWCKSKTGAIFSRKCRHNGTTYSASLTKEQYETVRNTFGVISWTIIDGDKIEFQSVNCIYMTGIYALKKVLEILEIEIVW